MLEFLDMDSNKLVVSEFIQNDANGKYNYDTEYQREKVWSDDKKSFLIDTILKNYPIPPVFLRMNIDRDTGATKYEVIDGKQRLTSIKDFVEGKIYLPEDFSGDNVGNPELNGASFEDLGKPGFEKYKRQFWHYRIPVIFIETDDDNMVRSVFDRLNRNGEPLVPQELRHAKYGTTQLYRLVDELTEEHIWKDIFNKTLETDRMEDKEFVSELLFVLLEKNILAYTKESLDDLYDKWLDTDITDVRIQYKNVMEYIKKLNLDYSNLKIGKVSHLYAVWIVGVLGLSQQIDPIQLGEYLSEFYMTYMNKLETVGVDDYRKSMSSNTKSIGSRRRRIESIISYLNSRGLSIELSL